MSLSPAATITPGRRLLGRLSVPGDKSISHRAWMFGSLAEGDTHIHGFLEGEDCFATLVALRQLGVRIEGPNAGHVVVHGPGITRLQAAEGALDPTALVAVTVKV